MHQTFKLIRLIVPLVVCLGLTSMVQAVGPDTDGAIAGSNNGAGIGVLVSRTTGIWNTGDGFAALNHLTTGIYNTALGGQALYSVTGGGYNTAVGLNALYHNTSNFNTASGALALFGNTSGTRNTATGVNALKANLSGSHNTAVGTNALFSNKASDNTAIGDSALYFNTTGSINTANGSNALSSNTTGIQNTANGAQALASNTTGIRNTAIGAFALVSNTTGGFNNTAAGFNSLPNNTTGNNNTALGAGAGNNVTTALNVIAIGTDGANVSNSCFIGNIYSHLQPIVGTNPDSVTISSNGRLGRGGVSSRRYKHDIKPMNKASEVLFALKPVSFRYNKEYDATQTIAYGLIAEEVAEVYPALVGRNPKGEPESVRYEQINAMLLNEFLKEHRKGQEQDATISQLKTVLAQQQKEIKALSAQIQKVSAQLEASKPAPRVVNNP
jgi:hypothetical protein